MKAQASRSVMPSNDSAGSSVTLRLARHVEKVDTCLALGGKVAELYFKKINSGQWLPVLSREQV